MYDELVKRLRELASIPEHCENVADCDECTKEAICLNFTDKRIMEVTTQAADAIEQLIEERDAYRKAMTNEHNRAARILWDKEHCWVPVTERLPEDGQDVLITVRRGTEIAGMWCSDSLVWQAMFYALSDEAITHFTTWSDDVLFIENVVAWMPLPEPPEEES